MGVWMRARGRLKIVPEPTEQMIKEYRVFSHYSIPDSYRPDEPFPNTWFFDNEKRLACLPGKFAEPSIWLDHLTKWFFDPRGYKLEGDPEIIDECDEGFWDTQINAELSKEYNEWLDKYPVNFY